MQTDAPAVTQQTDVNAVIAALPGERSSCGWFNSSFELQAGLAVTEDFDLCVYQLWSQASRSVH